MPTPQPLTIKTAQNRQVVDITDEVQKLTDKNAKVVMVYVAHTTCAVTTADLDPGTDLDLLDAAWEMIPKPATVPMVNL
jgi:thiamine phosphate synthase YjbQ (UPF0047 family)